METKFKIYLTNTNGCGNKMYIFIWAPDAFAAIDKLKGVLIGPGCEYTLSGCHPVFRDGEPLTREIL